MNKKRLPVGVRILLGFISFLLCIALFACSVVTILVADLALLTSKGGIKDLIMDVLFTTSAPARPGFAPAGLVPGRVPIRLTTPEEDALGGFDFGSIDFSGIVAGEGADQAIVDALYGILEEQFEGELPVSKEDVTDFVEKSTLPEFISDKVAGIVTDVINGEVTTTITKEDVIDLLEENKELIEDTFQVEIPEEVIDSVGTMVEDSKLSEVIQDSVSQMVGMEPAPKPDDDAEQDSPSGNGSSTATKPNKPIIRPSDMEVLENVVSGNVTDMGIADILAMVRVITSPVVVFGCIAVCLLISALLFLTKWGRPNAALRSSGVVYFIAGLLFLLPTAVAQFAPSLFAQLGVAGVAIRKVLLLAGNVSISVTAFGFVLIIAGAIVGSVMKKKRLAAAVAAATVTADAADLSEALLAEEETTEPVNVSAIDDGSELAEALLNAEAPAAEEAAEEAAAEEAEV